MENQASFAQRSQEMVHFNNRDMDYYLAWMMGRQFFDGSDPQECLDTAARISDGDIAAWQKTWPEMAEMIEQQAETALAQGFSQTARKAFLRACTYYRAPLFIMDAKDLAFKENWQKMQACFQKAAKLFAPPIEAIEVPYQGKALSGYFCKVDESDTRRPTLIICGGIETFREDCYFVAAPAGLARGYNVLMVDFPGQGINPDKGLFLDPRTERAAAVIVEYALSRSEVDPQRLAIFGFSWGGQMVLRAAQFEKRFKAVIANPATHNMFTSALAQQSGHKKGDPIAALVFQQLAWRFGVTLGQIGRRLRLAFDFLRYAKADCKKIECPVLCMAGTDEAEVTLKQTRQTYQLLPNPKKKLLILTKAEGGAAHCQINNLPLLNQSIYDWLDEVIP